MIFGSVDEIQATLVDFVGNVDLADPKGRKRLRIIEEATRQFVTHGYRKAAMGDVAKATGIAKGTIYLYFETKAELLVAAIAYEKIRTMSLLAGVFAEGISGRERLRRWVQAALLMVLESPLLGRIATEMHEFDSDLMARFVQVSMASRAKHEEFMQELVDGAVTPQVWDPADRHEQMVAMYALVRVAPMLRNEQMRLGVPLERVVAMTAAVIADGLMPRVIGGLGTEQKS
jgi:AcrR family transcriptional regulator